MITFYNIIIAVVWFVCVPIIFGNAVIQMCKKNHTLLLDYVYGMLGMWALFQIVSIPIILAKGHFNTIVAIDLILISLVSVYSIYNHQFCRIDLKNIFCNDTCPMIIMICMIIFIMYKTICYQHTDADDSRFVVNAVDILRTNRLFLTNPATGAFLTSWEGETIKDITSPWAIYIAMSSKVTGIHPTIIAHLILPVILTSLACCVFWLFSEQCVGKDKSVRCMFVCIVLLLHIFGYYSLYNVETFMMTRIWQGKAVVASVGIPMIWVNASWIYNNEKDTMCYILLLITALAMCFMSGMGIIISVIMIECIWITYGIVKRDITVWLKGSVAAIPGIVFWVINMSI